MVEVYIGIGANLGNREENVRRAIELLKKTVKVLAVSSMYETEPMYVESQPWFINCVVKAKTDLLPRELLESLKRVELTLGRREGERYGPRVIDLDILLYGDQIVKDGDLVIPHSKMQERAFVLAPLSEIEPDLVHPALGKSASRLFKELHTEKKIKKTSDS